MGKVMGNKSIKLLQDNPERYVLYPIHHHDVWELYKKQQANYWVAEELDFRSDRLDWVTLSESEQSFLVKVLAFFAASDGIVNENLIENFSRDCQLQEVRCFYSYQQMMENIHSEVYAMLLRTYVTDREKLDTLFSSIYQEGSIKAKAEWALRWISQGTFAERLVAFAIVEGVFFQASFASIFWMKKRGLMPGLTQSNELIARDEALHTEHACLLYTNYLAPDHLDSTYIKGHCRLPAERLHEIIRDAVRVEQDFVRDALPIRLVGMNQDQMCEYVQFVADRLLQQLGEQPIWFTSNPFDWMEISSLTPKNNFFEKQNTQYSMPGINTTNNHDNELSFNEDV